MLESGVCDGLRHEPTGYMCHLKFRVSRVLFSVTPLMGTDTSSVIAEHRATELTAQRAIIGSLKCRIFFSQCRRCHEMAALSLVFLSLYHNFSAFGLSHSRLTLFYIEHSEFETVNVFKST